MQQVFIAIFCSLISLGIANAQQTITLPSANPELDAQPKECISAYVTYKDFEKAAKTAGISGSAVKYANVAKDAEMCLKNDVEPDPEDSEFVCERIEQNCKNLIGAGADKLKEAMKEAKTDQKEAEENAKEARKETERLTKEIADYAKEAAEQENEILDELKTAQDEYEKKLEEEDKAALEQIQAIQKEIEELKNKNTAIVKAANRAMADLQKAKLNARTACREQAKKDYAATLAQLDAELAKRGGKISGGFEGIQNAENYRKFLVSKIRQPEPSENFSLCYSAGDMIENNLQQAGMNGALTLDEYSSQIEENNKRRESLIDQLNKQQELANHQNKKRFERHQQAIQLLNLKFQKHQKAVRDKNIALKKEIDGANKDLKDAKDKLEKLDQLADNAEARYNCARNGNTSASTNAQAVKDAYVDIQNLYGNLVSTCAYNSPASACAPCTNFRNGYEKGARPGGGASSSSTR